ncbi:MAG: CHASE2 domain-containing protein [Muribaculaceae bacterium]|nr:CHASE2 domain-containing protein [Muribaculaceae bacterium]
MRTIVFAIISTVCTILAWLWWNDRGLAIGKEETLMKWISILSLSLGKEFDHPPEDFLFINTANDLQLVEATDIEDMPIGNVAITDRAKLMELFQSLSKYPEYKYIFLDIQLDKRFETPFDSLLAEVINLTPRVVYAKHDVPLIDGLSPNKEGQVSYTTTWLNSDFCKYALQTNNGPSMAYKAYREIFPEEDKDVLGSFMPRLFFNLKLKYSGNESYSNFFASKNKIHHLGVDVLNPYVDFRKLIEDRYIFIGIFDSYDTHDTYLDRMDGIQIHANAFANLLKQNHQKHPLVIISIACISLIFYLLLFSRKKGNRRGLELPGIRNTMRGVRQKFQNKRWVRVILSFLTIELSFILLFFFLLFSTGRIVEITSISLLFTILWNLPSNRIYNYFKHHILKYGKT